MVEFNRRLIASRDTHFDVDLAELESIFKQLDQFRSITDRHERIMSMAAWILYRIVKSRLFFNGNKRSASVASIKFLNWNNYHLPLFSSVKKIEMHELLTGIQRHVKDFDGARKFLK